MGDLSFRYVHIIDIYIYGIYIYTHEYTIYNLHVYIYMYIRNQKLHVWQCMVQCSYSFLPKNHCIGKKNQHGKKTIRTEFLGTGFVDPT